MSETTRAPRRPGVGHGHGHPGGGMMPGEKARDFKGITRKLLAYMGGYKFALLMVIVFAIGGTAFNTFGPRVLSKATTEIYTGLVNKLSGTGGINFEKIGKILLALLVLST